jgi:hypothetical protein
VVGHEAIGPNLDRRLAAVLGKQIAVDFLVARLEENGLAPIAALRNVMRAIWNDNSSDAGHEGDISQRVSFAKVRAPRSRKILVAPCRQSSMDKVGNRLDVPLFRGYRCAATGI